MVYGISLLAHILVGEDPETLRKEQTTSTKNYKITGKRLSLSTLLTLNLSIRSNHFQPLQFSHHSLSIKISSPLNLESIIGSKLQNKHSSLHRL